MREFLTPEQRAGVKAIAERENVPMADVLRVAVRIFLASDPRSIESDPPLPPRAISARQLGQVPLLTRLKAARAERKVSLRQLAEQIPVRSDELSRFETGKLVLSESQIAAIEGWLTT